MQTDIKCKKAMTQISKQHITHTSLDSILQFSNPLIMQNWISSITSEWNIAVTFCRQTELYECLPRMWSVCYRVKYQCTTVTCLTSHYPITLQGLVVFSRYGLNNNGVRHYYNLRPPNLLSQQNNVYYITRAINYVIFWTLSKCTCTYTSNKNQIDIHLLWKSFLLYDQVFTFNTWKILWVGYNAPRIISYNRLVSSWWSFQYGREINTTILSVVSRFSSSIGSIITQ